MTATYTPSPVNQPAPPQLPAVQHSPYGAQAVQPYAPMPQGPMVIHQQPARSGNAAMGIAIVLLAFLAAIGGYLVAREQAPNADEIGRYQEIAAREGFRSGQYDGVAEGREFAIASQRRIAQYRSAIARQRNWNAGYRKGMAQGRQTPRRSSGYGYGGYSGYRAPRYNAPSSNQRAISSALGSAQALANATGAPVDVEIY